MKRFKILPIALLLFCIQFGFSQEEEKAEEPKKVDNTGTNPINFTYDYRIYFEMQQFKDNGGSQFRNIMELRAPLGRDLANVIGEEEGGPIGNWGNSMQLRLRVYYNTVNFNDAENTTVSGIGDFDARFMWIAHANSKWGIAPGLEAFFDTSSNDVLGSGSNIVAPMVFFGFFNLMGNRSIFAPGYQYQFNVDGKTVSRSILDLYFVWILAKGKNWVIVNPQPIYDHHNDVALAQVDVEWGFMIVPKSGIGGYIRPGFGVGADRPFNYNLEFAIKWVWR